MQDIYIHIKREISNNLADYLTLITCGVFFLTYMGIFSQSRVARFTGVCVFVACYLIWSILHHTGRRTLHIRSMIEYILIGFLALLIVSFMLLT